MVSNRDALVAGSSAGLVVDLAMYPIDTVKTRMQTKQGLKGLGMADIYKLRGVG